MKTTTVEISIGNVSIRIEAPADAPVVVNEVPKTEPLKPTGVWVHERKSRGGWTIPDRAPDHCSRCGAEGRRMNHEAGGCIECRHLTDDDLANREAPWTFVDAE